MRTKHAATTDKTLIVNNVRDADQGLAHQAMTVDFIPSSSPTEPTPPTEARPAKKVQVGRFQVTSVLGSGTFGTVYRAYDPLLDREVALKVPRFSADDNTMMERFHREAKAAARLHHPNIVALYESGESETGPYLVVELIDGVPLSRKLKEQPPDLRTAVEWVRQIAEGLHYAHTEGIVHRDVKPANIMMNHAGRPQIMDFGLAKRDADIDAGMTVEGQIVGTPNYMSPEQARGAITEIGAHSDQYSVGVVLYEMVCGRPPFTGDPWTIIARVANVRENPPPPRSVKPDLPRDLEACCLKAMEKEPKARYPSLQAMADDLDRWLKGLPLIARPIGPLEQLTRWCRHNRLIAGLSATVATMVIVAMIVGYILAYRFQDLATKASKEAKDAKEARELEEKARRATEIARDDEKKARLATERLIIDSYTETGLTAHRNGDPREAILWFANAVAASENYPLRERHNRIRLQSWLSQIAVPVQAFSMKPGWKKALSYHPSGHWLLSLTSGGEGSLLQVSDGQRHALPLEGNLSAAAFSPDGTRLAVAAGQDVGLFEFAWTPSSGHPAAGARTTEDSATFMVSEVDRWRHDDPVNCLQFSADGELLVLGCDLCVQVRDVPKKSFRTGSFDLGSQVSAIAVSANGRRFAVRCEDKQVRVYSCASDEPNSEPLMPPFPSASEGLLSPMFVGSDRLVVIDNGQSTRCWNIEKREIDWEYSPKRVMTCAISPDEKWIALGDNGDVVLLEAATGEPTEYRFEHPNLVNTISFHPHQPRLLTACVDHSARIFDLHSGKLLGPPIPHSDAVHRSLWSPDGTTFATVNWGGELIRVWKPSPQPDDFNHAADYLAQGPFVKLNASGDRWIPGSFDGWRDRREFVVCDVGTGQAVGPKLSGPGSISDSDFVPKSSLIVMVGGTSSEIEGGSTSKQRLESPGFIRFVNSETGEPAFPDVATPSLAIVVKASPDGRTVGVLCHQGQLLLLDATTGKLRAEHQAFGGRSAIYGYLIRERIRFSERGDQFVLWGCDSLAELRRSDTGELLTAIKHETSFIHDAQFSPDGTLLATCSSDHNVRLWDTATGASVGKPLAHSGWVFSAKFSRDSQRLLTASEDKQARIWDLATGTALVATREHGDQVFDVMFLPGEELFLASTRDGQISAWDSELGKMIAPARRLPGMVYQLSRRGTGSRVIASGQVSPMQSFDWKQWILDPDLKLTLADVRLLGELLAAQRIHESGAATTLTSDEWFERWADFRSRHPDHPAFNRPTLVFKDE